MDRKDFFKTGLKESAKTLYNSKIGEIVDRQLQSFSNLLRPIAAESENLNKPVIKNQTNHTITESNTTPKDKNSQIKAIKNTKTKQKKATKPKTDPRSHTDSFSFQTGYPRPPGSVRDLDRFKQLCTDCGDCIIGCPYGAIIRVPTEYGPVMDPNLSACMLCEDYPCIQSCDEQALLPLPNDVLPKFGQAVLEPQICLNINNSKTKSSETCSLCVDECPVEDAIELLSGATPIPFITADHCTGCGICVAVCPTGALHVTST
ncbi:MAG: 4Fe-4S binding protein [Leptonema sp. (in: Bacteria)]|nr:4Fe-4S binding protein [Leptonema sp. (in: bacteria)]